MALAGGGKQRAIALDYPVYYSPGASVDILNGFMARQAQARRSMGEPGRSARAQRHLLPSSGNARPNNSVSRPTKLFRLDLLPGG